MAAAARSLEVVEQALGNWIKLNRTGRLKGAANNHPVTAEQIEISRLRAELARVTSWEKRRRTLQRSRSEVCLYSTSQADLADSGAVPCAQGKRLWIPPTSGAVQADVRLVQPHLTCGEEDMPIFTFREALVEA